MKRYMKNKNFISESFYNKICESNSKKENKIISLFLILNLILLPISIKNSNALFNKYKLNNNDLNNLECKESENKEETHELIENIELYLENIQNPDIINADINNGIGEISVANIEALNKINLDEKIKIKSIKADKDEYKIEVVCQ